MSNEYVSKNFQIGPLGAHYPDIAYIMEGDSPSLMVSNDTTKSDPVQWSKELTVSLSTP